MKNVDKEIMEKLKVEIVDLEEEISQLRLDFQKMDRQRYEEWNKLMGVYDSKIRIVQDCINTRYKELNRLKLLQDHRKHDWISDKAHSIVDPKDGLTMQHYLKCDVCGKIKMRKVKLEKLVSK